jgi:hypothetical protein
MGLAARTVKCPCEGRHGRYVTSSAFVLVIAIDDPAPALSPAPAAWPMPKPKRSPLSPRAEPVARRPLTLSRFVVFMISSKRTFPGYGEKCCCQESVTAPQKKNPARSTSCYLDSWSMPGLADRLHWPIWRRRNLLPGSRARATGTAERMYDRATPGSGQFTCA